MAYRFPLATVLRFRESVEKREELALRRILLEIAHLRLEIAHKTTEIAQLQARCNAALEKPIAAAHLQSLRGEMQLALDRRKALIESLASLDRRRTAQMNAYQAAHRDRQMLTDMAARERDAWEQERARADQKRLDDIFAARAQRA